MYGLARLLWLDYYYREEMSVQRQLAEAGDDAAARAHIVKLVADMQRRRRGEDKPSPLRFTFHS